MDNNLSSKPKLDKAVVAIELAATYTRHTIIALFEKSEAPTVQTFEKHPYCSFELNVDEIDKSFGNTTLTENESRNKKHNSIRRLNLNHSYGTCWDLKYLLHEVFLFHKREANEYVSKTFPNRSHTYNIQWVIILPAGTQSQSDIKEAASRVGLLRNQCQYVFPSDVLALHNAKEEFKNKTNMTAEKEISQVSYVYFDDEFGEIGSYDILSDGTVCNNSRNTNQVDGASLEYYIEQLLCCIFTMGFIHWYGRKYIYNYYMLYKDFEEQIRQYDVSTGGITLNCKHFVTKVKTNHSVPVDSLIHDSKYRDTVRYNADTSSLVFSQQVLQMIMDNFKLSVTECLKYLVKHQTSLICYLPMELCKSSDNFQQRLENELQYNNGLLGSLACIKGVTVTSDYTIGYVAIQNFNKEQHSELNKTSLCHDNTVEECAIWLFRPLIKKGQQITVHNEFIWSESITFTSEQNKTSIHEAHVMRSKFSNPRYINEEGCKLAATIQSHPPAEGWPNEVDFQYTLMVTENGPIIRVIDLKAAQTITAELTYKLKIEFLKEPSSVAMQSPILAGLHPHSIKRRANHTYGIRKTTIFSRDITVLHKLIEKGQLLHQGQIFSATILPIGLNGDFTLYCSPLDNPRNIVDPNDQCKVIATINPNYLFLFGEDVMAEKFDVQLIIGDIDIMFKVIRRKTGEELMKYVDFQ